MAPPLGLPDDALVASIDSRTEPSEEFAMSYPPVYPHDPIEEIGTEIFMVRGSIRLNPIMRVTRNMAIIREECELSLINPIRLNTAGETQLRSLGEVRRIIRLGCFHGVDDPYYIEQFNTQFWSQAGDTTYPNPPIDQILTRETELPFAGAELFCFEATKQPESALLLNRDNGILLTCDAIQHYGDYRMNNLPARLLMPFIGFLKKMIIGPLWLKFMTPEGDSLKGEFQKLLKLKFDALLSAHGSFLPSGAHAAVSRAFDCVYGS